MAEYCITQVGITEICITEAGTSEIGTAEVGTAEVTDLFPRGEPFVQLRDTFVPP
jgi:hypothetical protein